MILSTPELAAVLLEQQVSFAGEPPRRLRLGLAMTPSAAESVLVIGGPLTRAVSEKLRTRGCEVVVVLDLAAAVEQMRARPFAVVATWPHVEGDADGLRFVRAFTQGQTAANEELRASYASVPFLVLPLDGTTEFALFASRGRWFLGNTSAVPLARAILEARSLVELRRAT